MMQWLRKLTVKVRPGAINRKARFVLDELGDYYHTAIKIYPNDVLPPEAPRHGKRLDGERLGIISDFGTLTVTWDGDPVFRHDGHSVTRLNYGEDWLSELNSLHAELQSKTARAHAARWRDL